jgi:acetyltransferase-like isoleucine patch superfamily enzyme
MLFLIKVFFSFKSRILTNRFYLVLQKIFHFTYLRYFGVETNFGDVTLIGLPIINRKKNSKIIVGQGVTLVSNSRGNVAGVNHPVILATLAEGAVIQLGNGVGISGSSICAVSKVTIGNNSGLGVNSNIYDTDFHVVSDFGKRQESILNAKSNPVQIGEKVWIAANVLILKGVTIGNGAVIGAGSIVRHDVPENALVSGNPAEVVQFLNKENNEKR